MSETDINRSSADELIYGIRDLYNKSKTSSLDMSCHMIDEKLARRTAAKNIAMALDVARSCKEVEAKFKKRSFYEKIIAKSMNAPSCSTLSHARCSNVTDRPNVSCSCEEMKTVSRRSLNAQFSSYNGIPKVLNAPRKLIKHAIGEIVLQLEKRIILHVFPQSEQIYYGPLEDLREVIASEPNKNVRAKLLRALDCRIQRLQPLGWDMEYHVTFGNRMMQRYGVGAPAWFYHEPDALVTHAQLARIISKKLAMDERLNMMTILSCLLCLALEDGRPLFLTCEGEEFQTLAS